MKGKHESKAVRLLMLLTVALLSSRAPAADDFSGFWLGAGVQGPADPDMDVEGAPLGLWDDLPLTTEAVARAETWSSGVQMQPIRDCWPHPLPFYAFSPKEIVHSEEKLVTMTEWNETIRTIWLDGRPHPPAWWLHTWQGFSTGEWSGDVLKVTTTHLKEGYFRRNGVPSSDQAVVIEWMYMLDGNLVTFALVDDPVYLTEPRWSVKTLRPAPEGTARAKYPCERREAWEYEEEHFTPHYLPEQNPHIDGSSVWPLGSNETVRQAPVRLPGFQQIKSQIEQDPIGVRLVSGSVYMVASPDGNMAMSVGEDGILLAGDPLAALNDETIAVIREVSDQPIRLIIATHFHADNRQLSPRLAAIAANEELRILAHENVRRRMEEAGLPADVLPSETFSEETTVEFNGEQISLIPVDPAHTDSDSYVFFKNANVIHAGDVYGTVSFSIADTASGGSQLGHVSALNQLIDTSIMAPAFLHGEGNAPGSWPNRPIGEVGRSTDNTDTLIIPGYGRLSDESDVTYYRDMLAIIRDRVADMIARGMTEEEVIAARPAFGWEALYKHEDGPFNMTAFVSGLYRELAE